MRLFIFLFFLIIIVAGIIAGLRANYLRIQNVDLQGLSEDKKPEVSEFIQSTLKGNKYLILPNNEIIFYSTEKLMNDLMTKYSFIQEATIEKKYPQELSVTIKERTPDAIYCTSECYFMDSTGLIYTQASSFSSGVYMRYEDITRDQSNNPVQTNLIDTTTYNEIKSLARELQLLGLTPIKITIIASKEIKIENENNGYILLNLDSPRDETVQNIKTVFIEGVQTFEYIDVRYGNKIFYKN